MAIDIAAPPEDTATDRETGERAPLPAPTPTDDSPPAPAAGQPSGALSVSGLNVYYGGFRAVPLQSLITLQAQHHSDE